jgi:hypothetical protein
VASCEGETDQAFMLDGNEPMGAKAEIILHRVREAAFAMVGDLKSSQRIGVFRTN